MDQDDFSHLFEDDALGVGGATEGISLPSGAQVSLLVVEIGPELGAPVLDVLSRRANSSGFAHLAMPELGTRGKGSGDAAAVREGQHWGKGERHEKILPKTRGERMKPLHLGDVRCKQQLLDLSAESWTNVR